jgi:hypothetical protein
MRAAVSLVAVLLVVAILATTVTAVSVPSSQQSSTIIAEIGGQSRAYIVLQDISSVSLITASGEKASWVMFNGSPSAEIHPSLTGILQVTISVPSDAGLGTYAVDLMAGGSKIADMTIKTTLSQSAISSLQTELSGLRLLADVNSNMGLINTRLDDMNRRINSTQTAIENMTQVQSQINTIKNETLSLSGRVDELKTSQGSPLTGMFFEGTPLGAVLGFVAGAVVALVVAGRGSIRRRISGRAYA